jgi:hypothetical protein
MSTARRQGRRPPVPAAWPATGPGPAARPWAIIPAGLAPVLLTGSYLIAGILQPASYSPVRKTISAMAGQAGTDRWIMTGGIVLVAGCYLVTAAGLTGIRAPARALLILAGLAGIGIAASPEPATGATPRHLAWTALGAVTTAIWPAFAAPRTTPRPLILSVCGSAAVTAVFTALLGWVFIETRDGSVLGLAERLTSSIQTCWPFIIALTLRRARPRPAAHAQPEPPPPAARPSPGHPAGRPNTQTVPAIPGRTVVRRPREAARPPAAHHSLPDTGAADNGSQPRRHRPDGNRISRHRRPAADQRATAGQRLADPVAAAARRPDRPGGHRPGR